MYTIIKEKSINQIERELDERLIQELRIKLDKEQSEEQFAEVVESGLTIARIQSEKNKKKYFSFQQWTIIISALNTLFSILITVEEQKSIEIIKYFIKEQWAQQVYFGVKFLGILLPVIVTSLLALQKLKKYDETWMRHSKRYNRLRCETINYLNDIHYAEEVDHIQMNEAKESSCEQEEASSVESESEPCINNQLASKKTKEYKENIMKILKENHEKFCTNMQKSK